MVTFELLLKSIAQQHALQTAPIFNSNVYKHLVNKILYRNKYLILLQLYIAIKKLFRFKTLRQFHIKETFNRFYIEYDENFVQTYKNSYALTKSFSAKHNFYASQYFFFASFLHLTKLFGKFSLLNFGIECSGNDF